MIASRPAFILNFCFAGWYSTLQNEAGMFFVFCGLRATDVILFPIRPAGSIRPFGASSSGAKMSRGGPSRRLLCHLDNFKRSRNVLYLLLDKGCGYVPIPVSRESAA